MIARRSRCAPRCLKDASDYEIKQQVRYRTFATNSRRGQIAHLDARHRKHARVEPRQQGVRDGPAALPRDECQCRLTDGHDLRAWLQLLALDGEEAKATPRTLRYRILHVPARLVRGRRKRRLKLFETGLRTAAIVRALTRILALPHPT